jgi:hypothetical protein
LVRISMMDGMVGKLMVKMEHKNKLILKIIGII